MAFLIQFAITPYVGAAQETQEEILQASITKDEFEVVEEVVKDHYELLVEDINEDVLLNYDEKDKARALTLYYVDQNSSDLTEGTSVQSRGRILWSVLRTALKKDAKKKMGPKVEKKIGNDFDKKVWPKIEREAKKEYDKYGYSRRVGPVSSTAPNCIKQGEHIFELYGDNGNSYLRFHVFKSQSGSYKR
ncbi:YpjP family protein [Peribacillus butanolivorans]